MALLFWSDPHLGLNRTSHTTPASRAKLRQALLQQATVVLDSAESTADIPICLGDLFDTTDNEELVIAQGSNIASRCALVLSGNHDLANRDGKMSSLELLGSLNPDTAVALDDTTANYFVLEFPDANVIAIPHKRTQQLFDASLLRVLTEVRRSSKPRILVLHCNYESPFATDDASLNLSRELAGRLLEVVDYVLIGHEHMPRADFNGRLQLLGNIHPTSFADISDKFIFTFSQGKLTPLYVWTKDEGHRSYDWETFLSAPVEEYDGIQFIDITGTAPASKLPDIAKAVQKLWSQAPDALMIRNNVKSESVDIEVKEMNRALDIPSRITEELQGTAFAELWGDYLERV